MPGFLRPVPTGEQKSAAEPISVGLFLLFASDNPLVDGLTSTKTFFQSVPVLDLLFSEFPAQQDDLVVYLAGEIEQADIEIFHLNANGFDFGECVLGSLNGFVALGPPSRYFGNVDEKAATQENAVIQVLKLLICLFDKLFAIN